MMKLPSKYLIGKTTDGNLSVSHKFIGYDYRLHWHDCCEAEIVLSGSGTQELNGNRYRLEPG